MPNTVEVHFASALFHSEPQLGLKTPSTKPFLHNWTKTSSRSCSNYSQLAIAVQVSNRTNANRHQMFVPSWCLSSLTPKLCAAAVTEVSLAAATPLGGLAAEAPSAAAAAAAATVSAAVIAAARPLALPIRAALQLLPPGGLYSDDTAAAAAVRPAVCALRPLLPLPLLLLTRLPQVRQIGADARKVATLHSDEQHRASHIGMVD